MGGRGRIILRILLISCRATSVLFESAEAEGISRDSLVRPLGLDPGPLSDVSQTVAWSVLVEILEQLRKEVGGDVERIRRVGRHMPRMPSYAVFQRFARATLSLDTLYRIGERWMIPAMFPHVLLFQSPSEGRLRIHMEIPEPHEPSAPFFHIAEGAMAAMPTLLGLPVAELGETRVTPRTMDTVFLLPPNRSARSLVARAVRAVAFRRDMRVLEAQRQIQSASIRSLQRAHDELRTLLENLPNMVLVHADDRVLWVNRAFASALGYDDTGALVGTPISALVDPRSRGMLDPAGPSRKGVGAFVEGWFVARDGETVLVELAPTQDVVFGGVPARLVAGRDITERVRMQQQLVTADRLASLGLLAAGVAHEVNNPLAYVLNNIEIAQRQLAPFGGVVEAARGALATAIDGVDRIRFIVRELLVLARGDSAPVGPIDVVSAVESTLALARSEIVRSARLEKSFDSVPPVVANTARVSQVVLNLVLNALQAMGGTNATENVLAVRIGSAGDKWVAIDVSDTGVGIAPDAMARVFDPFYSTKPTGQGTGLGLAISQRLVSELGGEITVTSTVGKGTTFRVLLPALSRVIREQGSKDARPAQRAP